MTLEERGIVGQLLSLAKCKVIDALNELDSPDHSNEQLVPGHIDEASRYMKQARELCTQAKWHN